jgi:flagellar protein FlaJ
MAAEPGTENERKTGGATGGSDGIDWLELAESVLDAYERMEIPLRRYGLLVLAPAAMLFGFSIVGLVVLPFGLVVRVPLVMLGTVLFGAALVYPKLLVEQQRIGLERQINLIVTHMTVLSQTNIDRVEVFRTLAQEEEYGELAEEMGRIVQLVDAWNQSLDEACQRRARQVPSKPLSDFLDRMAYSLNAGQELGDFLLGEQEAMTQAYVTVYEGTLDNLEVMKDLYLSMILSMVFALVNAVVLPMLTGVDAATTVAAVLVVFVLVQAGFYYVIRTMSPYDPVWYQAADHDTRDDWLLTGTVAGAAVLAAFLLVGGAVMWFLGGPLGRFAADLPLPLKAAIPVTPLVVPGIVVRRMEENIKDVDEEFPTFIRALGSSESAKQATTTTVLTTLREKDFGELSRHIEGLYTRLSMRLDTGHSWYLFAAESRSYLVQKFSEMYNLGRQMGGEPKLLGELISRNMNEVLQLREQRRQATVTLIGVIYGITAASSFTMFIGLEVTVKLAEISSEMNLDATGFGAQLLYAGVYDVPTIEYLLTLIVLFNAALSSLMIRQVDGGHKANAYFHFVLLTWLGALLGVATRSVAGALL